MKNIITCFLMSIALASCGSGTSTPPANDDRLQANAINKDGAVETELTTEHLDSLRDVIVTKHRIWNQNMMSKEVTYRDTVRALGKMPSQSNDGNAALVNKDYEFYITVK